METWPAPKKGKFHAASSLNVGEYFRWIQIPLEDQQNFDTFLNWLPSPRLNEYVLETEITRALAEIYRSNRLLVSGKCECMCLCE